jgi:hypothetical protein
VNQPGELIQMRRPENVNLGLLRNPIRHETMLTESQRRKPKQVWFQHILAEQFDMLIGQPGVLLMVNGGELSKND